MKQINVIFLIVVILNCYNIRAEEKHKEVVDDIHRYIMGDDSSDNNTRHSFIGGDSVHQVLEQEAEVERDRERVRQANQVSTTLYKGSYTGQGSDIKVVGTSWEQCVIYAKKATGITRSIGYAGTAQTQGQEAQVGAIALEWNHASVVIAVYDDSIRVEESNYYRGKITRRTTPKNQVRGYIYS